MVRAMQDPPEKEAAPRTLSRFVRGAIGLGAGGLLALQGACAPARGQGAGPRPETLTVTGIRVSQGGAVDCPEIRDDAGVRHPVSGLPSRIALGERVTVRGRLAVTTSCRGLVLVVEELVKDARSDAASGGE